MDIVLSLKKLGFSDKEAAVYNALVQLGPSSVRGIAEKAGVNRGTTYDILKALIAQGVVSYLDKAKGQYFVAEEPKYLQKIIDSKKEQLAQMESDLHEVLPMIQSVYDSAGGNPVVKLYDGYAGAAFILHDILETMKTQKDKTYYAFSSGTTAFVGSMYKEFPNYTKQRIKNNITVQVIAIGDRGEGVPELAERKYMSKSVDESAPAYILIYAHKLAYIGVNSAGEPWGLIIEDVAVAVTQKMVFKQLWKLL